MTERPPLTSEGLRALAADVVAAVRRHAPDWAGPNDPDPGLTLLELFAWLADGLSALQDQAAAEAALDTRRRLGRVRHALSEAGVMVTVDGAVWDPAASSPADGADGPTYRFETGADGTATVTFGDGRAGARPPAGSEVVATYRHGGGAPGVSVTLRWPPEPRAVAVRLAPAGLAFATVPPSRDRPVG